MSVARWYGLVGGEVIGPFDTLDPWYHEHAGPDWRHREYTRTGIDPWSIGRDTLPDGREVSTVFLGLDHAWNPSSSPLVFETMILPDCELYGRCSTLTQARALHAHALHEHADSPGPTHGE